MGRCSEQIRGGVVSKTADELTAYLRYAQRVSELLPVNEEADREITKLLNERTAQMPTRKLTTRKP